MELKQKVITAKTPELAARRICSWVNGPGVGVDVVSVSQIEFNGWIVTTLFWREYLKESELFKDKKNDKYRPKIGERRLKRQPLKIDRFPVTVKSAITYLREQGHTWVEIASRSALPFSQNWATDEGGFVDWNSLSGDILEAFQNHQIPPTNLCRWYDLRVEQNSSLGDHLYENS